MAKNTKTISRFIGGIAEFDREGTNPDCYAFGRSIDVRSNPRNFSILPRTIKESGSLITALPKWGEYIPLGDITYIYDEAGNIYSRSSTPTYTFLHTMPNSHGNGMSWFGEDNFLYYTSDKLIGRYGPVGSSNPRFVDDFFGSQGGVPLNTNSLSLVSASTQYASRADTASLSITGDLSIEASIKPTTLPTIGNTMTLVSKWTENGNIRSYKLGIGTVSNYFGDGSDGNLIISSDTIDAPIDSACTGTINTNTLSATNASFAANQIVFIHQTQGTGAGQWMRNTIQSYTAGTITLVNPLNATYTTGAQVLVVKQYGNVTVNANRTYSAKPWGGTTGGILVILASGTVTVNGTINATGKGFRGGNASSGLNRGYSGEGTGGVSAMARQNGNGGGGGNDGYNATGGAGGGNATIGGDGGNGGHMWYQQALGGSISGSNDLTTATFGGGGGGKGGGSTSGVSCGGNGGGLIFISAVTFTMGGSTSSITANGVLGVSVDGLYGGSGAGGSILIKAQTATLGDALILANGQNSQGSGAGLGGGGGDGRICLDYLTSYTGTTTPTLNAIKDDSLGAVNGYSLFLSLSSNGTAIETYTKPANIQTGIWQNIAVSWNHAKTGSTSEATLFLNGVSLGTVGGLLTSIHDNASTFNVGMDRDGSSNPQNLYNGLIDEVRIYAGLRTSEDIIANMYQQINPATIGLVGYYKLNGDANDATANANNLTVTGGTYSTDIPFSSPTSRLDIDQSASTSGNTYALPAVISETATNRKTFTPQKDPQKSLSVYISAVGAGSGSWTLTIHDQFNNVITSKTVAKSALPTGTYEFIFSTPWRPLTNLTNSYHFHLTDSDATGTVKTTSANDLETVTFATYFSFLIEDTSFHPLAKMLQFLVVGNERYVGKYEATIYEPNYLALPAGWRIQCFGYYQEYLAIGCIRGNSITDQDMGRIYFWDGISEDANGNGVYNFYVDVPQGGVSALLGANGKLYVWAGYQGQMLLYTSGFPSSSISQLRQVPYMEKSKYCQIYPQAVTMWQSLIRYGVAGYSDSLGIYRGVYSYGSINNKYPEILTYDYPISTGNTNKADLRIGMLMTVNQRLLIGWSDGVGYGIDYVQADNDCYPTAEIRFLIDDSNAIWKEKLFNTYVSKFAKLTTGQSITPKYKYDDSSSWSYGNAVTSSSDDPTLSRSIITNERYYEKQYGLDLETTTGTNITVKGVGVEVDERTEERRV